MGAVIWTWFGSKYSVWFIKYICIRIILQFLLAHTWLVVTDTLFVLHICRLFLKIQHNCFEINWPSGRSCRDCCNVMKDAMNWQIQPPHPRLLLEVEVPPPHQTITSVPYWPDNSLLQSFSVTEMRVKEWCGPHKGPLRGSPRSTRQVGCRHTHNNTLSTTVAH